MKTRIITGGVMALLVIVIFALPYIATAVLVGLLSAIAAYELLYRTGLAAQKGLVGIAAAAAFGVPMWCYWDMPYQWGLLGLLLFTSAVFCLLLRCHEKVSIQQVAWTFVGGLVLPFLLSSIVRIRGMEYGTLFVWIPCLIAALSDSGAYFTGFFLGRHKLAPVISPKKTVEGLIGGVAAGIGAMLVYAWILRDGFAMTVSFPAALVYGFAGSFGGVLGDLSFSVIKRQVHLKDYGNLFPGHGGILDRFDSLMIVGPLTEALLLLVPLVV